MATREAFARIVERYRALQQFGEIDESTERYFDTLGDDGRWPDLDYSGALDWDPPTHMNRLASMARAYVRDGHRLAGDPYLLDVIGRGIDHWLDHRYQTRNWWYNDIGVPRDMATVAMLLDGEINPARRAGGLSILDQAGRPGEPGREAYWRWRDGRSNAGPVTGANLVWLAWNVVLRACLRGDGEELDRCARIVWDEIRVGAAEGIQIDGSFYQHGPHLQNFHYGLSFCEHVSELAWLLRDTPYAIPDDKRRIVSELILEGDRWLCRGEMTVPGTLDRSVTRPGAMRVRSLRTILALWRDVAPEVEGEMSAFADALAGGEAAVEGFRHFPYGDISAYHCKDFSLFVKTVSTRTGLSETMNDENLRGVPYLNCGDHYLIRHGDEYHDLPPAWDWPRIPGLTASARPSVPVRTPWVGGVGNGVSGCAVMLYARRGEERADEWSVRRLWAFHDGVMLCLLGGWQIPPGVGELSASLEQCRRSGDVYASIDGDVRRLADGDHHLDGVRWALHREVGYLPLSPAPMRIELARITAPWTEINKQYAQEPPVSADRIVIEMLRPETEGGAGYALVGRADIRRLDALAANPPWRILANDSAQQAVQFADGTTMAAFHEPGAVVVDGREILRAERPCVALRTDDELWVCDPSHTGGELRLTWLGVERTLQLPADGRGASVRADGSKGRPG